MTIGFRDIGFRTNKHNKKEEAFLQLVNCCYTQMFQANIFLHSKKRQKKKKGQSLEFYGNLFKKKKNLKGAFFIIRIDKDMVN